MLFPRRQGESFYLSILQRKERIVFDDSGYFYRARECDLIGPFETESETLRDLNVFIDVTKIEASSQHIEFAQAI